MVPVPASPDKLKKRGYNQTTLTAKYLAPRLGVPVAVDLLVRERETAAMRHLTREERRTNLLDAFAVPEERQEELTGKAILLLDDVYTTGSTANACARALKKAGASKIIVLTFAAGTMHNRKKEDLPIEEA